MVSVIEAARASGIAPTDPIKVSAAAELVLAVTPKRLVVILDTSGSMRRFENDAFKPAVEEVFAHLTRRRPDLEEVWVLDAQGRELYGAEGRPKHPGEREPQNLVEVLQPTVGFSGSDPTVALVRALKVLADESGSFREPWDIVILGDELFIKNAALFGAVMNLELGQAADGSAAAGLRIRLHVVQFPISISGVEPSTGAAFAQYAAVLTAKFGGRYFRVSE